MKDAMFKVQNEKSSRNEEWIESPETVRSNKRPISCHSIDLTDTKKTKRDS